MCVDGVCVCGVCLQSGGTGSEEHPAGAAAEEESGGRLEQQRHGPGASLRRKPSSLKQPISITQKPRCCSHALPGSLQAHCHYVVVKLFVDKLQQVEDAAVKSVLSTLALLYALTGIADNSGDFLKVGTLPVTARGRGLH